MTWVRLAGLAVERQLTNLTNVESSCACVTHGIKPDTYHLTWVRLAVERQLTNLTNVQSSCACANATRGIKPTTYQLTWVRLLGLAV